jgi:macrodomain Ter protein organizer (MatP/YcbG family)
MTITSMKIHVDVRDRLAKVAAEDFPGATLSDTVAQLLAEHERSQLRQHISAAYARLRENRQEWEAYTAELDEWEVVSADSSEHRG